MVLVMTRVTGLKIRIWIKWLTYLVIFHSGHCKKLTPEYEGAAEVLSKNDPPIALAKVDATAEKTLAERFGIQGFPTLFWFK